MIFCGGTAWSEEADLINLDPIVVTSSRMAQHNYKIASNVTVIDQARIEASNARTVSEIIKEELGVNIYDNSTVKTSVVDIRGFGDTATRNILVLVNDRKVNTIDISGPDLVQIPLASVERIEILRGAGSVLYGDNAVGGVVNIITKKGKGPISGKTGVTYGSYDSLGEDLELSGSKDKFAYYLYSQYYNTGGYRENSDMLSKNYNARVDYTHSEKLSLDLDVGWHEDDYRLPGGLNDTTELETLGRRGTANPDDFASSKDRYFKMGFDLKPWPQDIDLGHLSTEVSYRNRDTYAWFDYGAFGATATRRNIDTLGVSSKYIFDKILFNRNINFVTGLDFYDAHNDILGSGAGLSTSSDNLTISKQELGAYSYSEYELFPHFYLNGGGRYQKAYYTFDRRDTPFYDQQEPGVQAYLLGGKYEYAKGSNVHLNAQQTFRFLATDEWYDTFAGLNTNLKQQTGIQYEVGIKHNFNDVATVSLTPYWMDIKDEIFFDPVTVFFGSNRNYDRTRRIGTEFGAKADILKFISVPAVNKLEFFANYTYQEPTFRKGSFEGMDIPLVPRNQANTGLNLEFQNHYKFSISGTYVGSRFAINDTLNETPPVKPYFVLDSKLGFSAKFVDIYFGINNILNEKYSSYVVKSSTSTVKDYFPAPERNYTVEAKFKF